MLAGSAVAPTFESHAQDRDWGQDGGHEENANENSEHEDQVQIRRAIPARFAHLSLHPSEVDRIDDPCHQQHRQWDTRPRHVPSSAVDQADKGEPPHAISEKMGAQIEENLHDAPKSSGTILKSPCDAQKFHCGMRINGAAAGKILLSVKSKTYYDFRQRVWVRHVHCGFISKRG